MIHCISNNKEEGEAEVMHHSDSHQIGLRCSKGPPTWSFLPPIDKVAKYVMKAQCNFFSFPPNNVQFISRTREQRPFRHVLQEAKHIAALENSIMLALYLCLPLLLLNDYNTHRGGGEKQILLIMWCPGMSLCKRGCQLTYHMWDKPYYC